MIFMRSATMGLALAMGATGAQAADLLSRQIANEPVEITVTQTPGGTVITRRPLATAPLYTAPAYATPAYAAPAYATPAYAAPAYVAPPYGYGAVAPAPVYTQRAYVRPAYAAPAVTTYAPAPPTYATETVGVALAQPVVTTRRVTRTTTRTRVSHAGHEGRVVRSVTRTARVVGPAVMLEPAQRRLIYRAIVQEQLVPTPPAYTAYPRRAVFPPNATTGYAVTAPMDDDVVVERIPPAAPAYATTATYAVGSVLPAEVAVAPLPATAAVAVPAVQAYSYATVNGRVLLIDPATDTVVADITP